MAQHSHSKIVHDSSRLGRSFKEKLRKGAILIGATLSEYARPSLAKIYAQEGFDFLFVESEHGSFSPTCFADTVLCARDNHLLVIAKTPQLERPAVARLLECGVVGIQLPRTESRRDLETLIQYMKLPPIGTRAGAPGYGNTDYLPPNDSTAWLRNTNHATVIVAHIETAEGFKNAEEIISTPLLDMLYVGPYDFSISMGHPGEYDHPYVLKPMEKILEICKAHRIPFGTTASGIGSAKRWIERGAQFFETADELSLIRDGARELLSRYREVISVRGATRRQRNA